MCQASAGDGALHPPRLPVKCHLRSARSIRRKGAHILNNCIHQSRTRGTRRPRNVRCDKQSLARIIRCGWFHCEHIQPSPGNAALIQCFRQSRLIDQRTPTRVEQKRGRFHQCKSLLIHRVFGFWRERTMQADDVALAKDIFHFLGGLLAPACPPSGQFFQSR